MPEATYQLQPLSESTNFLPISIVSITSTTPTPIHTVSLNNFDECWIDCFNYSNEDGIITLCLGGTAPHQRIIKPVPAGRGLIDLVKGLRFTGGIVISAYASSANIISVVGSVNSIIFV